MSQFEVNETFAKLYRPGDFFWFRKGELIIREDRLIFKHPEFTQEITYDQIKYISHKTNFMLFGFFVCIETMNGYRYVVSFQIFDTTYQKLVDAIPVEKYSEIRFPLTRWGWTLLAVLNWFCAILNVAALKDFTAIAPALAVHYLLYYLLARKLYLLAAKIPGALKRKLLKYILIPYIGLFHIAGYYTIHSYEVEER